jgi:hypothetical protein
MTPAEAAIVIIRATREAVDRINGFSQEVLRTRGGRLGSGLGTLLEALWGFHVNQVLQEMGVPCEIGWLPGQEYNDFASIRRGEPWTPERRDGELLRIEAKSMNIAAEESKGHFDELAHSLSDWDLLLVLIWSWESLDEYRVYPKIRDFFIDSALRVAALRDRLHVARGGSFVDRASCPDGCIAQNCQHHGEPLNADGKRERRTGPESRRVSQKVPYAANFGGLVRMLKTDSDRARRIFRQARTEDEVAHAYISFIHRNFPKEEINQYTRSEWAQIAQEAGVPISGLPKGQLAAKLRESVRDYQERLRALGRA